MASSPTVTSHIDDIPVYGVYDLRRLSRSIVGAERALATFNGIANSCNTTMRDMEIVLKPPFLTRRFWQRIMDGNKLKTKAAKRARKKKMKAIGRKHWKRKGKK